MLAAVFEAARLQFVPGQLIAPPWPWLGWSIVLVGFPATALLTGQPVWAHGGMIGA